MVLFVGDFSQEQAIQSVDFNTIGLLVGMMVLVYLTQQTGVYDYLAIRAGQLSGGRSFAVTMALAGTTALLSAFLDNLTTILLVAPITFLLADALDIEAVPLLIIEVIASNLGGTATLIGDPPNLIIAGATGLSFNAFIVNLAPIVLITLGVVIPLLYIFFRKRLQVTESARRAVMELDAASGSEHHSPRSQTPQNGAIAVQDPQWRILLSQAAGSPLHGNTEVKASLCARPGRSTPSLSFTASFSMSDAARRRRRF